MLERIQKFGMESRELSILYVCWLLVSTLGELDMWTALQLINGNSYYLFLSESFWQHWLLTHNSQVSVSPLFDLFSFHNFIACYSLLKVLIIGLARGERTETCVKGMGRDKDKEIDKVMWMEFVWKEDWYFSGKLAWAGLKKKKCLVKFAGLPLSFFGG